MRILTVAAVALLAIYGFTSPLGKIGSGCHRR
jgi:hypothetical protein